MNDMKILPKDINMLAVEEKWQKKWEEMGIYHFDRNDKKRKPYVIDTPPPYPSGDFHMGNVLNWTYFDILARYKRMKGYNVYFPQGWDCHGLGIEVRAEKENHIKKRDMPPDQFRKLCERLVEKYIAMMRDSIIRLGISVDWTTEYRTMDPDYWRRTQLSFILLHKKGFMYQGEHPVNWCPGCETAIADAEVNYEQHEGTLHYIHFPLEGKNEFLRIATTRPELIPACVAVAIHPEDERLEKYKNAKVTVPLCGRSVAIIVDEIVDPAFGTGIVMICTYGDKADVKTVLKHKLEPIIILSGDGRLNEKAGKYAGLSTKEARKAIVKDLKSEGLLEKTEKIVQEIGLCDRCDSPIEILQTMQWFMKSRKLTDKIVETANSIVWYPDYMKSRMIDWACSLDWDWVISRQKIFGTPIPVWYCKKCGEVVLADESWVPVDPKLEKPKIEKCPKCGGKEFVGEWDVFDTWMDSSITCAVHAGWPDRNEWRDLFPADVHPSGTDIIRTWAYYLMVRHLALFDETPYKSCLINGMVLGLDGRKMSKSLENYVATPEALSKYGADASRQWAAGGGATGSDIPFRWADTEYGWRFLIKLWNASRFAGQHLQDYKSNDKTQPKLELLDRWLLTKLEKATEKVTAALEECQFNIALEETRNFAWHVLCDQYIEAVKHRLYKPETYGIRKRTAAQHTLYTAIYRTLQLLAPVAPHITEEIYQIIYADDKEHRSIHVLPWPEAKKEFIDEEAEKYGDLAIAVIEEIRRDKAERRLSLNAPIKQLTIYASTEKSAHVLKQAMEDIEGTCKTQKITVLTESGEGKGIEGYSGIRFAAEYLA
jgi:valyl-tRNA synthetase